MAFSICSVLDFVWAASVPVAINAAPAAAVINNRNANRMVCLIAWKIRPLAPNPSPRSGERGEIQNASPRSGERGEIQTALQKAGTGQKNGLVAEQLLRNQVEIVL